MWKLEWKKLCTNSTFLFLIAGCFLINGFLLWRQGNQYDDEKRCFPKDVHAVYKELENVKEEEKIAYLSKELEKTEMVDEIASYNRRGALQTVLTSLEETSNYDSYLEEMKKQANRIANSALYADANEFSKRNAKKIPVRYEHLRGLQPKAADYTSFVLATEQKITDVAAVLLVMILSFFFFTMEKEEGTLSFVRCTKYGGRPLGIRKMSVILLGSAAGIVLLYIENFLLASSMFGYPPLSGWIQGVDGFLASPWKIKVVNYIVFFLLSKVLAILAIGAIVIWVCLHGKTILTTCGILLGIAIAEYSLYTGISLASRFNILKWCNLFSFLRTERFFQTYETVNVFNYPVSAFALCVTVATGIFFLFMYWNISCYEKVSREEYGKKTKRIHTFARKAKGHTIFRYELRKIFAINGAGIVIILFLIVQLYQATSYKVYFSMDEIFYKNYLKELSGPMTPEKAKYIEKEDIRLQNLEKEELTIEIENKLLCKNAFEQVKAQANRIGADGCFLDEIAFSYILDQRSFLLRLGIMLGVTLLAFFQIFIMEKISGMELLFHTVPDGRRKSTFQKWSILLVTLLIMSLAMEGSFLWKIMRTQNIHDLSVPLRYMLDYEHAGKITAEMYLLFRGIIAFLSSVVAVGVIAKVSDKVKNAVTVLLVSGGIVGTVYLGVVLFVL